MRLPAWLFILYVFCTALGGADLTDDFIMHKLSEHHPFYSKLEKIFAYSKTLDSERNFLKAGFTILQLRDPMFVIAMHPQLPGHLVKVHLRSSDRDPEKRWKNLITRCNNAAKLREFIEKEKIRYFTVPDKLIYVTKDGDPVFIVTRMNICSERETRYAWKNHVKHKHLKELQLILSNGLGSSKLVENIPYTKEGLFTCIDTEKPSQGNSYIKKYLSEEMSIYWNNLTRESK